MSQPLYYLRQQFVLVLLFAGLYSTVQAQLVNTNYGQNRLQYEQYKWNRYESPNFALYYPKQEEKLAKVILPIIEADYLELARLFEHQLKKRIEVLIYSDFSDYLQSNLGIYQHQVNQGGVTRIFTPKIQLYFTGDHQALRRQIRKGLASLLLGKILVGTNLQEIVQNSVLMNLPAWFVQGAIAHATEDWNSKMDDQLRDALLSGKYANFVELANKEPLLAGQSLFHFVAQEHSASTVSNLLYLTRINRSVENGFLYVFGKTYYQVVGTDWFKYYSRRYNKDSKDRRFPSKGALEVNIPVNATVKHLKISPNGKLVAFAQHKKGLRKVVVYNTETKEQSVVYKEGAFDYTDLYEQHYPLIDWSHNGQELFILYEQKDKVRLRTYDVEKKQLNKSKRLGAIERVTSLDVIDRKSMILTGFKNGQSDLYHYEIGGQLTMRTNDYWDEKEAVVMSIRGRKGVVFSSNRTELKVGWKESEGKERRWASSFDLYFYPLEGKNRTLIQLTRTPLANECDPIALGPEGKLSYLSDVTGIYNRYVAEVDSVLLRTERVMVLENGREFVQQGDSTYSHLPVDSTYERPIYIITGIAEANTDYSRNILEHDATKKKVADLIYRTGSYHIFVRTAKPDRAMEAVMPTNYRKIIEKKAGISSLEKSTRAIRGSTPKVPQSTPKQKEPANPKPKVLELEEPKPQLDTLPPPVDTGKIDIDNYQFQSEFEDVKEPENQTEDLNTSIQPTILVEDGENIRATERPQAPKISIAKNEIKSVDWNETHAQPYKSLFKVDKITFQVDNTPLYNGLNIYLGNYYEFQPLSFVFKTSFTDIFEHFNLELGIRVPFDFNGIEYFVDFENRKGLIDQKYSFYRQERVGAYVLTDTSNNVAFEAQGRAIKHLIQAQFSYPLDKFQRISATPMIQLDEVAILANERTLQVPVYYENRFGLRLDYTFDNTNELRLNARKGTKVKAYLDFYKPFTVQTMEGFRVGFEGGLTTAIGFDARHYLTFDDRTIFAFRATAASSFGQQKILYSLGGVENWMFPTTSGTITLPDAADYGLQTLSSSMRGFQNNARNGSSFALINAEIRVPIIEYLSRNSPRNAVLRNLQLVTFVDVGTAWRGTSPFSIDNPLNTTVIDNNGVGSVSPVRVTVNYYRRPILVGYGIGLRTVILGHYIRLDYAWGVETGQVQTPILYLSVGTDF